MGEDEVLVNSYNKCKLFILKTGATKRMFGLFGKKKNIEGLMKEGMTRSQKRARVQTYKSFYEGKIKSLKDKKLPPPLLLLACKDAPFDPGNLDTKGKRNAYIKKCLKYYNQQLSIIEKEAKKLKIY